MSADRRRPRRTTNTQFDDLTQQCNALRSMLRSLLMLHESPEKLLDSSPEGRAKLIANAKKLLTGEA